ncbi:MAG: hypothetical protein R3B37_13235 [Nitrospira sp.]|nr:hypothetical protein [Nitrospira sp.]
MKASILISVFILSGAMVAATAFANPSMLPNHPGYPMGKATDPVTGQPLANDPGRDNAVGDEALSKAAAFGDQQLLLQQRMAIQDKASGAMSKAQDSDGGSGMKSDRPMKGSGSQSPSK